LSQPGGRPPCLAAANPNRLGLALFPRVLALRDKRGRVYLILVPEAQTSKKNAKSSRWPLYYSHLRVRYNCKVLLLVIAPSQEVAD
jgi:hypothetical protein